MRCLLAVAVVLSLLSGWCCAQAPGDAQSFCTVFLPGFRFNILDYLPEVKPLMDSRHYQQLLPPNMGAVWQTVDNDNNNPGGTTTSVSCYTLPLSIVIDHLQYVKVEGKSWEHTP